MMSTCGKRWCELEARDYAAPCAVFLARFGARDAPDGTDVVATVDGIERVCWRCRHLESCHTPKAAAA